MGSYLASQGLILMLRIRFIKNRIFSFFETTTPKHILAIVDLIAIQDKIGVIDPVCKKCIVPVVDRDGVLREAPIVTIVRVVLVFAVLSSDEILSFFEIFGVKGMEEIF